jgi:phosphoenolpyruvate-protein kinase (PTS system EI component)
MTRKDELSPASSCASSATTRSMGHTASSLLEVENPSLQARARDLEQIVGRMLERLTKQPSVSADTMSATAPWYLGWSSRTR